jgi:demethylmenaquinone methyltransferase/2-methoxy-6-polyprenyl-1,4-benzoquinol methylase
VLRKYYDAEEARQPFITALFDAGARHYDRVSDLIAFGSGRSYRHWTLRRAGLGAGMSVLDVATGTGQVARAARTIVGERGRVIGVDPSAGMLAEARRTPGARYVRGQAEALPFAGGFDFVTMGYALRHVADLGVTFREFMRVLKPGGRVVVLEISLPRSAILRAALRLHMQHVLPLVMGRDPSAALLTRYYWDTIAECVPPETILAVLRDTGFVDVGRHVIGGTVSEYLATKPDPAAR